MKFQKICTDIVSVLSFAVILGLFLICIFRTCTMESGVWENTIYHKDSLFLNLTTIVCACALLWLFIRCNESKISYKKEYCAITILYFVINLYCIYSVNPGWDQEMCATAAVGLLNGDYSMWSYGNYCYSWTNQNGLILYFALVFRLFGMFNYLALYIINSVMYLVATCLIRRIGKHYIKNEQIPFLIWMGMLWFFPMQYYCGFAYGTIPGFFFSVLTMYLYFEICNGNKKRKYLIPLSCVTLFLAICLKSNYMIFAIALIIACFVRAVSHRSIKQFLYTLLLIAVFIFSIMAPGALLSKITGNATNQGVPAIAWVVMGLQTHEGGTAGWFNHYNYNIYLESGGNHELAAALAKEDLKEVLQFHMDHPRHVVQFFYQKIASQWINPDFQAHSVLFFRENKNDLLHWFVDDESKYYGVYIWILDRMLTIVYFGNLCWLFFKRKWNNVGIRLGYITFLGGFIFHLFWEGKCQYAIPYFVLLIPTAVWGLGEFVSFLVNLKENRLNRAKT